MHDITLPDTPTLYEPIFDDTEPLFVGDTPSDDLNFVEDYYNSTLNNALRGKFEAELDGAVGISPTIQQDMWDLETERDADALQDAKDRVANDWAKAGWSLPDGVLSAALYHIEREYLNKRLDKSRDIRIETFKTSVESMTMIVQQGNANEQIMIAYHTQVQQRRLDAAKAAVELAIEVFKALVAKYNADTEMYKARARVYAIKLQINEHYVNLYRAQIDAAKSIVEIDKSYVELYMAQLKALETQVGIYKAEMEAARILADIRRLTLDIYKAKIDVYQVKAQARVVEVQLYEALNTRGELAKVELYKGQLDGFRAKIEGITKQAETNIAKNRGV